LRFRLLEVFLVERFAAVLDLAEVFVFAAEDWASTGTVEDSKKVPASDDTKIRSNRRQFTTTSILALKVGP
jgi:hypothetical protein